MDLQELTQATLRHETTLRNMLAQQARLLPAMEEAYRYYITTQPGANSPLKRQLEQPSDDELHYKEARDEDDEDADL